MSYDAEELRAGIADMFRCEQRWNHGELTGTVFLRIRESTDKQLLKEVRNARPLPRVHPPLKDKPVRKERPQKPPKTPRLLLTAEMKRARRSAYKRRMRAEARKSRKSRPVIQVNLTPQTRRTGTCLQCGARATFHRCPVTLDKTE